MDDSIQLPAAAEPVPAPASSSLTTQTAPTSFQPFGAALSPPVPSPDVEMNSALEETTSSGGSVAVEPAAAEVSKELAPTFLEDNSTNSTSVPLETSSTLDDTRMTADASAAPTEPTFPPPQPIEPEPEVFKVPALPPPGLHGLPADIEHILSLGANEKDPAEEDGNRGTTNYEQVVREMKEKAGFGTGQVKMDEGEGEGESVVTEGLEGIEKEMERGGVTRNVEQGVDGEAMEEDENERTKPVSAMDGDSCVLPFSLQPSVAKPSSAQVIFRLILIVLRLRLRRRPFPPTHRINLRPSIHILHSDCSKETSPQATQPSPRRLD
jgi:hypothetical protein